MNTLSNYGFAEFAVSDLPDNIKFIAHFYATHEGFGVAINLFHNSDNIRRVVFRISLLKYMHLAASSNSIDQIIGLAITKFKKDGWPERFTSMSPVDPVEFVESL